MLGPKRFNLIITNYNLLLIWLMIAWGMIHHSDNDPEPTLRYKIMKKNKMLVQIISVDKEQVACK